MKSKKGVMSWIVVVILFLAVTLVILGLVYKIKVVGESALRKGVCKLSVEKLALGKKIPLFGKELTGYRLDCERKELVFKKSETPDEKSEKLAKAIASCMDNFWEGRKDFTDVDFMTGSTHCAICSKIRFEDGATFNANNYYRWEEEHKYLPGSQLSYKDYFLNINKKDKEKQTVTIFKAYPHVIDNPHKEYYLYFYVVQGQTGIEKTFNTLLGTRAGWLVSLSTKAAYEVGRWLQETLIPERVKQVSVFKIELIDNALKDCENLLN